MAEVISKEDVTFYKSKIKTKLYRLREVCKSIRTLSSAFVMSSTGVHLDFKELIASWDSDWRPEIRGSKIEFVNVGTDRIILENGEVIWYPTLQPEEIKKIYDYLNLMLRNDV